MDLIKNFILITINLTYCRERSYVRKFIEPPLLLSNLTATKSFLLLKFCESGVPSQY